MAGDRMGTGIVRRKRQLGIAELLKALAAQGIDFKDLHSSQSSLEEIFVNLLRERR